MSITTLNTQIQQKEKYLSKIFPAYLAVMLLALAGVSWVAYHGLKDLQSQCRQGLRNNHELMFKESEHVVNSLGEQLIRSIAEHEAAELKLYLENRPGQTLSQLHLDPEFRKLAIRPVGESGYTAIVDYDNIACLFHKNLELENKPFSIFRDELPDFWEVIEKVKGGQSAAGYYDWQDPDGVVREKYMWITPIPMRTADNVGLAVAATTYIDEFSRPVRALNKQMDKVLTKQLEGLNQSGRRVTALLLGILFLIQTISGILVWVMISLLIKSKGLLWTQNEALSRNEESLEQVMRIGRNFTWQLDAEGRYVSVSPAVKDILGLDPEVMVGQHYTDYFSSSSWTNVQYSIFGQTPLNGFVSRMCNHGKDDYVLETYTQPLRSPTGELVGICGIDHDITKQHKMKQQIERSFKNQKIINQLMALHLTEKCASELLDNAFEQILSIAERKEKMAGHITLFPAICESLGIDSPTLSVFPRIKSLVQMAQSPNPTCTQAEKVYCGKNCSKWCNGSHYSFPLLSSSKNSIGTVEICLEEARLDSQEIETLNTAASIVANIVQHKQNTLELNRSRDFYLKLFDEFPNPIWRSDKSGGIDYVNEAWITFTGHALCPQMREAWMNWIHPDDRSEFLALRWQAFRNRAQFECEYRLMHNDGNYHWLRDFGRPFEDYNGEFCGYIGTLIDINEQKLAQLELEESVQNLAEAKSAEEAKNLQYMYLLQKLDMAKEQLEQEHCKLEQTLSSIGSILISCDKEMMVTQWNKKAQEVFGLSPDLVIGQMFLTCGIRWDWDVFLGYADQCYDKDMTVHIDSQVYERRGGETGFLSLTLSPIKTSDGLHRGLVIVADDITKRKKLEAQLSQAQKLESIGQLAAGIAHEINTPIQYVGDNTRFFNDSIKDIFQILNQFRQLQAEYIQSGTIAPLTIEQIDQTLNGTDINYLQEEIPVAIHQTLEGVERVASIVRAMKEFSHPDEDKKAPSDLNRAILSTVTVCRNEWKYVADLETDFDPDLPLVPCLVGELNQVILNMIVNAAHAINERLEAEKLSGEKGSICIQTRQDEGCVQIKISDTGAGIPASVVSKIYDPFFTTKEVGKGTGQGLAIAHNVIVEKHGGTITCDSVPGRGTAFTINLPINENGKEK